MARPEGLEPPTTWFEARYSIQLSYGRVREQCIVLGVCNVITTYHDVTIREPQFSAQLVTPEVC